MTVSTIDFSAVEAQTFAELKAKPLAWKQAFYAIQEARGQENNCRTKADWTANKLVTYSVYRNFSVGQIQAVASHLTEKSPVKLALEGKRKQLSNAWFDFKTAKAAGKSRACSAIILQRIKPLEREIAQLKELVAQAA